MSIGPRRNGIDNSAMRKVMNDGYARQQDRIKNNSKINENTNYEIEERSGFRLAGIFLVKILATTIVVIGILGFLIYIVI